MNHVRTIVHFDTGVFFASVSCEAHKFGIYAPMPVARARKPYPKRIVLPGSRPEGDAVSGHAPGLFDDVAWYA